LATIYDVARVAGVSPKTVSRVLNREGPVNERTRRAVEAAMAGLAYVPSSAARSMRSSRTGLVGLVTGAISGEAADGGLTGLPDLQIVQGIQRAMGDAGFILLISDTNGLPERVPELVRTLREHRVEGIFYVAGHHQRVELSAAARHDQMVLVNCFDDASTPCVLPDDEFGQYELTRALIAAGHRRIGFLTLPETLRAQRLRLDGYVRAFAEADIAYDRRLVVVGDHNGGPEELEALLAAIDRFSALKAPPTALLCGNDRLAVGLYGVLRARGMAVPREVSVAGYDDYRVISETLYPALTTMELPYVRMGEAAAGLMLAALRGDGFPQDRRVAVRGALKWRDSVVPLAH
jgi:LacI family transcriptional regulator